MSTDTTAMQDMIAWMEKYNMDCTSLALKEAQRLLSKEKEQIEKAYFDGVERELNGDAISPQEYFNQTYNKQ